MCVCVILMYCEIVYMAWYTILTHTDRKQKERERDQSWTHTHTLGFGYLWRQISKWSPEVLEGVSEVTSITIHPSIEQ